MTIHNPTAAAFYLQYLLEAGAAMGAQPEWLAPLAALDQKGSRVDCRLLDQGLEILAQHLSADFSLLLGERVTPKALDILALASMSCATLEQAVSLLGQFEIYRLGAFHCELQYEPEQLAVVLTPLLADLPTAPFQTEAALAGWVTFGRWLTRAHENPLSIEFRHAARLPESRYQQTFNCPVRFNASRNAVLLRRAHFELPVATPNATVSRLTSDQLLATVTEYLQGDVWRAAVRHKLLTMLPMGEPTIDQVAQDMALSVDELTRRLRTHGSGFGELLDDERKSLARTYVESGQLSMAQIAQALGYSEQSAFNRAFRRWYDASPRRFRR